MTTAMECLFGDYMVVVMTGETPWTNIVGGSSRVSTCTEKKLKLFSQIIRIITYVHINTFSSFVQNR